MNGVMKPNLVKQKQLFIVLLYEHLYDETRVVLYSLDIHFIKFYPYCVIM